MLLNVEMYFPHCSTHHTNKVMVLAGSHYKPKTVCPMIFLDKTGYGLILTLRSLKSDLTYLYIFISFIKQEILKATVMLHLMEPDSFN